MSGGKGGGSRTSVQIPQWIQDPMQRGISRAEDMSRMGYQPYYGPEVAAFSPMQIAAMQSSADAASAFGLAPQMDVSAGIPTPTEYVGGVRGYGSGDIFEQSLNEFNKRQPAQAAIYNDLFAGPDVGRIDYGDNGGNDRPVMSGGGGEGGGMDPLTGGYGNNALVNAGGLGSAGGLGTSGGFSDYGYNPTNLNGMGGMPIDYTTGQPFNPASGTGPFVAQGMGAQNPIMPIVGGGVGGGGSVDPFNPFTDRRGGVTGTPVSFPEGQAGSSDLLANYIGSRGNLGFGGFNPYGMGA